jgi:hypothetical protein
MIRAFRGSSHLAFRLYIAVTSGITRKPKSFTPKLNVPRVVTFPKERQVMHMLFTPMLADGMMVQQGGAVCAVVLMVLAILRK